MQDLHVFYALAFEGRVFPSTQSNAISKKYFYL